MDTSAYKQRMHKALDHLLHELSGFHVGRATSSLVDSITVSVSYGTMKLNQLANVVVMDSQTLKIEAWDKWVISSIEKAIYDSGTGLTPKNEWDYILVKVPPLTQERRQELTKLVSKLGEETKVSFRNIRHDALKDLKQDLDAKLISEDQKKWGEHAVDALIKDMSLQVEEIVKKKTEEIMKV